MRTLATFVGLSALLASTAVAQIGSPRQQQAPPADSWMTIDSLAAALSLTAEQRAAVAPHLTELNAVMKEASDERQQMRNEMGSANQANRQEAFAAMRDRFQAMQARIDAKQGQIRALLTASQQTAFDALAKPQLTRQRPPR